MWKIALQIWKLLKILSSIGVIKFGILEGNKEWDAINADMGLLKKPKDGAPYDDVQEYEASKAERIQRWFRILRMILNKKYPDIKYLSVILNFIHALISMKYKVTGITQD